MIFDKTVNDLMKAYNLTAPDVAVAYLLACNIPPIDAYSMVKGDKFADRKSAAYFATRPAIQSLSVQLHARLNGDSQPITVELPIPNQTKRRVKDFADKGVMLDELNRLAASAEDKDKLAILKQIADLQRLKEEVDKSESKVVHFYVPIQCKDCKRLKA
jgi:hypothetical protein